MTKLIPITKEQDESVKMVLENALSAQYETVIVVGYKKKVFEVTHSAGVSTIEELGALEITKHTILNSAGGE